MQSRISKVHACFATTGRMTGIFYPLLLVGRGEWNMDIDIRVNTQS